MYRLTRQQTAAAVLIVLGLSGVLYLSNRNVSRLEPPKKGIPSAHGEPIFRQRLVAVGDLHGDFENAKTVLHMAGIIDSPSNPTWSAGSDILVQTGDIVDRGAYSWDIYRLMQSLRSEASGKGGKVVSILGNHEVMNAIGDWRYVTSEEIKYEGGYEKRMEDIGEGGWLGKEWLANYSTTALVTLSPYPSSPLLSFTHGSLRPSYPNLLPYPDRINSLGHSLLSKALRYPLAPPHPPNPYSGLPADATAQEIELYAAGGPYWWRGLAEMENERTVCRWAGDLQKKLGVRRIIGGHTPNFEKIVDRCNASIIIIDTGISRAYGGILSALEIVYALHPVQRPDDGHRQDPFMATPRTESDLVLGERYWEREELNAIYPSGRKLIAIQEGEIAL